MSSNGKKAAGAALAVLMFGLAIVAEATPASAQWRGGWHGGGWHGGGWRGGYWRGGRWYGSGWGGPFAAGVVGGLAVGAIAASAYPYYGPGYGGCVVQNQPAYDAWGNFVGYQAVQACY